MSWTRDFCVFVVLQGCLLLGSSNAATNLRLCVDTLHSNEFRNNPEKVKRECVESRTHWKKRIKTSVAETKGYRCVPEMPDLIENVFQSSFPDGVERNHLMSKDNLTDDNSGTCVSTKFMEYGSIGLQLSSAVPVYAVRISSNIKHFDAHNIYPLVIIRRNGQEKECNVCEVPTGPQVLYILCQKGSYADEILLKDTRPGPHFFFICDLKIYADRGETSGTTQSTTNFSTTTETATRTGDVSNRSNVNNGKKNPDKISKTVLIIIAASCFVVLLCILVLIIYIIKNRSSSWKIPILRCSKRFRKSNRANGRPRPESNPENHIYNAVVYEEIEQTSPSNSNRPDLLQCCENIYAVPDEMGRSSPVAGDASRVVYELDSNVGRFKTNEVYAIPETDVQDVSLDVAGASGQSMENELYAYTEENTEPSDEVEPKEV